MTDKEINELGKQEYAKWRAERNKLNLLKGAMDESRVSTEPVSV